MLKAMGYLRDYIKHRWFCWRESRMGIPELDREQAKREQDENFFTDMRYGKHRKKEA